MRNFLSVVVYIILQILFIPLAIVGIIITGYKQIVVSKKLGVSQTAIEIINGRWTMHVFGMRQDPGAAKLTPVLPNTSTAGLWLALFPLYVKYKISGRYSIYPTIAEKGEEKIANLVMNRTLYFDRLIESCAQDVKQIVLLGAGLDTRAYGALDLQRLKWFELDTPLNQHHKLRYLRKAGIDAGHVSFVEVNFNDDDWFENLIKAGFDATQKTIFLWEGVTLYLSEKSVRKTISVLRSNSAPGSVILCDIYSRGFVSGEFIKGGKATKKTLDYTQEQLEFSLEMQVNYEENLEAFASSNNLALGRHDFLGYKDDRGPYAVVAEFRLEQ